MGNRDVAEQLEAAIEEVGKLEREVATLRAEKDSPHADAKYWRELQEARADLAESMDCNAGIAANFSRYYDAWEQVKTERDAALLAIADALDADDNGQPRNVINMILSRSPIVRFDDLAVYHREVKAEALEESDRDWASYIEGIGSHVGDPEFTQALVVKLMRGPRPFGCEAGK